MLFEGLVKLSDSNDQRYLFLQIINVTKVTLDEYISVVLFVNDFDGFHRKIQLKVVF